MCAFVCEKIAIFIATNKSEQSFWSDNKDVMILSIIPLYRYNNDGKWKRAQIWYTTNFWYTNNSIYDYAPTFLLPLTFCHCLQTEKKNYFWYRHSRISRKFWNTATNNYGCIFQLQKVVEVKKTTAYTQRIFNLWMRLDWSFHYHVLVFTHFSLIVFFPLQLYFRLMTLSISCVPLDNFRYCFQQRERENHVDCYTAWNCCCFSSFNTKRTCNAFCVNVRDCSGYSMYLS